MTQDESGILSLGEARVSGRNGRAPCFRSEYKPPITRMGADTATANRTVLFTRMRLQGVPTFMVT